MDWNACRKLRQALGHTLAVVRSLLIASITAALLLWVAHFNGYPTIFSDSGGYLWTGKFLVALAPFRAPGYAIFTRWASLGASAWCVIAAQALIVVYVLRETCAYLMGGDRKSTDRLLLAGVCIMAALTSLPWFVSLVMPDVFAGVLFLSASLLAFSGELSAVRRAALAAILMISASAHTSLLPIGIAFAAAIMLIRLVRPRPAALSIRSTAAWLLIPLLASGLFTASLNRKMGLGFRYSASGNSFLLAKLFSEGLAADYLRSHCPSESLVSCRYLDVLPVTQEEFLFRHPLAQELFQREDETRAIVHGAVLMHPLKFAASSVRDSLLLLTSFRTGDEIRTYGARDWNAGVFEEIFPGDARAFSRSKQSHGLLSRLADAAASVDGTVFWMSVAICLLAAGSGRFGRANELFYAAAVFLFINAVICATVGGVYDRYQARVAWIVPFCAVAYVGCLARESQSSEASDSSYIETAAEAQAEA